MLSQDEKRKLKKNAALYARMPVQLQIDTSNQHYSQIQNQKAQNFMAAKSSPTLPGERACIQISMVSPVARYPSRLM